MQIFDLSKFVNPIYKSLYHDYYWIDQAPQCATGLRVDDAWPAVCYAHGIYDDLPKIFGVAAQIDFLRSNKTRNPVRCLEIGSGRGEISCVLAHMNYLVTAIDCNRCCAHVTKATARDLFGVPPGDNLVLCLSDLNTIPDYLLSDIDTVIMCESIEHIDSLEWWTFFEKIQAPLKSQRGHLVITNLPQYWPLGGENDCPEHISVIDDVFFDRLESYATTVVKRSTSHLVLEL